jgi:hypothetical protein
MPNEPLQPIGTKTPLRLNGSVFWSNSVRFFRRILGTKQAEPPLSSLEDPILGRLTWDDDSEGWVSSISLGDAVFRLYIGGGSAQEYPSDALLDLLKEPHQTFQRLSGEASAYLRANVNLDAWKVNPEDLKLEGLRRTSII